MSFANNLFLRGVLPAASLALVAPTALAAADDDGKVTFKVTYRYEYVDHEGDEVANASNADLLVGYKTPSHEGVFGYFETETVAPIGDEKFNSTVNGLAKYPVVLDPEGSEINQMYIGYSGDALPKTSIKVGRQRIILDNARHIGNVGWRLNEMTYDAATVVNSSVENLTLIGSYVWNANTISGANLIVDMGAVVNAGYSIADIGKLSGYAYLFDYSDASGLRDQATYGARLAGSRKLNDNLKAIYEAEFATQSAYADTDELGVSYFHIVAGAGFSDYWLKGGYESQGSEAGTASFRTFTGTNHAFNGWADRFLATPVSGLSDLYVGAGGKVAAVNGLAFAAFFHDFAAVEGDAHYGTEIDGVVKYKHDAHHSFGAKCASFSADEYAPDNNTTKFWAWVTHTF
ncbi:MAG: hypothetical protein CME06_07390 [Gemmatimonadetes bacterium]|nr:hypothetical protein [Gemmatimonadota bacterium]